MSPVSAIALSGMNAALQRFNAAAGGIAGMRSSETAAVRDIVTDTLDLISAKQDFAANLVLLRTESEMLGALLDIRV